MAEVDEPKRKSWLEQTPAIIAVGTSAVLLLTVIHEWGYFSVVGPHFQTLLTTTDYLSNAILWLPLTTVALAGSAVVVVRKSKPTVRDPEQSPREVTMSIAKNVVQILVAGAAAATFMFAVTPRVAFIFSMCAAVAALVGGVIVGMRFGLTGVQERLIFAIPILASSGVLAGTYDALTDLTRTRTIYTVKFKGEAAPKDLFPMRSLEKGMLARDKSSGRIEFIRWDGVEDLSTVYPSGHTIPICKWIPCGSLDLQPRPSPSSQTS